MRKLIILLMFWSFSVFAEPVDINKASAKEIAASLDGIGKIKAQAIVKYRKQHGAFKSMDDLRNVKGIGEKTLAKNKGNLNLKGSIGKATSSKTKAKKKTGLKSKAKSKEKTLKKEKKVKSKGKTKSKGKKAKAKGKKTKK